MSVFTTLTGGQDAFLETSACALIDPARSRRARYSVAQLMTTTALTVLASAGHGSFQAHAQTLPENGVVASGQVAIGESQGGSLLISQSSATGIIGWQSFSIGSGGSVHFANGSGATLNRVSGNVPSSIDGSLTATGSVYLVNPAGITVGTNGFVSTGGSFIASTHDVEDSNFLGGGDLSFKGASEASIINRGRIGSLGGDVALIARHVDNSGTLEAPEGTAALAAGYEILMRDGAVADGKFIVKVGGGDTEAKTTGSIKAAEVELRANGGNVYALAGNTSGIIKATGVENRGGRVFLTAPGGSVEVTQKVTARRKRSFSPSSQDQAVSGGDIRIAGSRVDVGGEVDARGQAAAGGSVVITGETVSLGDSARVDASGATGGTVLIGGDYQGGHAPDMNFLAEETARAKTTSVASGAVISADGSQGDGGNIVVWSDEVTSFDGHVSARGGVDGTGGFAEISGKRLLGFKGTVDLKAQSGRTGRLLLDPYNIVISGDPTANGGLAAGSFTPNGDDSVLDVATLAAALDSAHVTVTTGAAGSPGAQAGDITVDAAITWSSASTLTLDAYRNIAVNANITGGAGAHVVLRADNSGTGVGAVTFANPGIDVTATGGVSLYYNPSSYAAATDYSGNQGAGTIINAYMLVNDVSQLQNISTNLQGYYALGRNIDASITASWNAGEGFVPIGSGGGNQFKGVFDGQNHVIDGLFINRQTMDNVGLFGFAENSIIRNVGLTNVDVTGRQNVGGLVGHHQATGGQSATIDSAWAEGLVRALDDGLGGLVGVNEANGAGSSSEIINSWAETVLTGKERVGGLVGYNQSAAGGMSWIVDSHARGSITATASRIGGLIGWNVGSGSGSFSLISGSYSEVALAGSGNRYGGLVGYQESNNSGAATIEHSWASGAITAVTSESVGGLVGENYAASGGVSTIEDSHASAAVTARSSVGGLVGLNENNNSTTNILNSYSTGIVTGSDNSIGGLVGRSYAEGGAASISFSNLWASGAVSGNAQIGGLFGRVELNSGATGAMSNSYASGSITAGGNEAGGALGFLQVAGGSFTMSDLSATGAVAGRAKTGGLIGLISASGTNVSVSLRQSYAEGIVTGTSEVGGLIGEIGLSGEQGSVSIVSSYAAGATSATGNAVGGLIGNAQSFAVNSALTVDKSYALGSVTGDNFLGGLIGFQFSNDAPGVGATASITESYASGRITGTGGSQGGISGSLAGGATIASSFWDKTSTNQAFSAGNDPGNPGAVGLQSSDSLTADYAFKETAYAGWDFSPSGDWVLIEGVTRPMGRWEISSTITNGHQLQLMALDLSAVYTMGRDINLTGLMGQGGLWTTAGFNPLGDSGTAFTGSFDGQSHTITGLKIDRATTDNVGLFGVASNAVITDVGLMDVEIVGGDQVGALVGQLTAGNGGSSLVDRSYATGSVAGTTFYRAGGLIGWAVAAGSASSVIIDRSYAEVMVSHNGRAGGLIGDVEASGLGSSVVIDRSYSSSTLTGYWQMGGLIGKGAASGDNSSIVIDRSHAIGHVTGTDTLGGLIGLLENTAVGATTHVSNSYATGNVSGTLALGGLIGRNYSGGLTSTIENSYATGNVSGNNTSVGGLIGSNEADYAGSVTVRTSYATGAVSGTDQIGGLIGRNITQNASSSIAVETSFALGAVNGNDDVGGLIGGNIALGGSLNVNETYAIGRVSGTTDTGGLVGSNGAGSTISSSFWNPVTSGQSDAVGDAPGHGGVLALQTSDAAGANYAFAASTYIAAGWDMGGTWGVITDAAYPYHQWRFTSGPSVIAGTVSGISGGNAGVEIKAAIDGTVLGATHTGADGSYYVMGDAAGSAGAALSWLTGNRWQGGAVPEWGNSVVATAQKPSSTSYHALGLGITAGMISVETGLTALTDMVTGVLAQAKGTISDVAIRYATSGPALTLAANASLDIMAVNDFTIDTGIAATGTGRVRVVAGGALGIAAGGSITSAAGGDAVVLSGTSFDNQRGSDAIATGAGRWLVYATAPAGNTYGDLDSGNHAVWNTAYDPLGAIAPTGNRYVFAYQPTVSFTSSDQSKTYGDTVDLSSAFSLTGLHAGVTNAFLADTASTAFSGAPVVTSSGSGATIDVGDYAIVIAPDNVTAINGYAIGGFTSSGVLAVEQRSLTVTADNASKMAGEADPLFTWSLTGGSVASFDVLGDVVGGSLTRAPGEAGGDYSILQGTLSANPNYALTFVSGILSIQELDLPGAGAAPVAAPPIFLEKPPVQFSMSDESYLDVEMKPALFADNEGDQAKDTAQSCSSSVNGAVCDRNR